MDQRQDFIRLHVLHHEALTGLERACQKIYGHDTTVIVDISGDEEALRARMKKRGRRDVNKAQRECPAVINEETDISQQDFFELVDIMHDTSARQGFEDHSADYYWTFFTHFRERGSARLFVGRHEGKPVNWGLFLVHGDFATYEIAASSDEARSWGAPDLTLYEGFLALQANGVRHVDLVAIGSDFAPELNTLNRFKTKWAQDVTGVSAPMEIVLHPLRYRTLNGLAYALGRA